MCAGRVTGGAVAGVGCRRCHVGADCGLGKIAGLATGRVAAGGWVSRRVAGAGSAAGADVAADILVLGAGDGGAGGCAVRLVGPGVSCPTGAGVPGAWIRHIGAGGIGTAVGGAVATVDIYTRCIGQ